MDYPRSTTLKWTQTYPFGQHGTSKASPTHSLLYSAKEIKETSAHKLQVVFILSHEIIISTVNNLMWLILVLNYDIPVRSAMLEFLLVLLVRNSQFTCSRASFKSYGNIAPYIQLRCITNKWQVWQNRIWVKLKYQELWTSFQNFN